MKDNWQALCDDILNGISSGDFSKGQNAAAARDNAGKAKKPRLLLHACCAPCSSYTLEYLCEYFDITIYYYNPNIHPAQEYQRRLAELENFLPRFLANQNALAGTAAADVRIDLQETDYNPQEFFDAVQAQRDNLENESERGERCCRCYQLRMEKAYEYARQNGFDWFTTTLSISPHKDAQKINEIGRALEARARDALQGQNAAASAPKFLYSDFKKKNGYKRSLELSKEYGLYRQDYCGCQYSKANTEKARAGGCLN
ncbi:MAG: epoxyqueuosine reductase QueH [Treponema sp.]|nr:epoxyqueuosine reductase QueH [Treponema sp.]